MAFEMFISWFSNSTIGAELYPFIEQVDRIASGLDKQLLAIKNQAVETMHTNFDVASANCGWVSVAVWLAEGAIVSVACVEGLIFFVDFLDCFRLLERDGLGAIFEGSTSANYGVMLVKHRNE